MRRREPGTQMIGYILFIGMFAGGGFLIGGPIGAVIGGLIGMVFSAL
jgi:hypothetical protein